MKISIITVFYKVEKTIRYTINFLLNQTYKNLEYLIIHGKSNNKTLEIIESFTGSRIKLITIKDKSLFDVFNNIPNIKYKILINPL